MKHKKSYLMIVSSLLAVGLATGAQAQDGFTEGLKNAVSEGTAKVDFRYRFENVDDDDFRKDANASTLRSRLTFQSGTVGGFTGLMEFDNVTYIGNDDFNSTENGKVDRPVVADPKGTEVNQAWLKYGVESLSGIYGRQRILHGSQRFVGGVAWRQNEQTYDGFRAQWGEASNLHLDYAYVYNINRIFGPDDSTAQPANWKGDNHLARLDWKLTDDHTVTGFIYALEIDERGSWSPNKSVNNSTDTYGVEYSGKLGPLGAKAAYAKQSDAGDSYLDYDADYYMLEGAMTFAGITGKLGYEVLGADNGVGFKTPLATAHKFQGWADKFLTTPGDGIEDLYLGATGKLGPVKLGAFYHDFSAEDSSEDFGTEWDLVGTWAINKQFTTQLKYANFSSDSNRYSDTQKLWVTLQLKL
ncbi:MAG: alginate export family protein [Halioglobus sp.]